MNIEDISTQLIFTTVPIRCVQNNGNHSVGTGFLYAKEKNERETIPLIITNYHVIEDMINGYIEFNVTTDGEIPNLKDSIKISFDSNMPIYRIDDLDVAVIPLVPFISSAKQQGVNIFFKTVNDDLFPKNDTINNLSAIEDITFIGYPSGIYDEVNHLSIVRKGFTATPIWNNYKGNPDFLIDGGIFPGSSGSPVFIYNQGSFATNEGITMGTRLLFVGIIYETNFSNGSFLNLGIAINSIAIKKGLEKLLTQIS